MSVNPITDTPERIIEILSAGEEIDAALSIFWNTSTMSFHVFDYDGSVEGSGSTLKGALLSFARNLSKQYPHLASEAGGDLGVLLRELPIYDAVLSNLRATTVNIA